MEGERNDLAVWAFDSCAGIDVDILGGVRAKRDWLLLAGVCSLRSAHLSLYGPTSSQLGKIMLPVKPLPGNQTSALTVVVFADNLYAHFGEV